MTCGSSGPLPSTTYDAPFVCAAAVSPAHASLKIRPENYAPGINPCSTTFATAQHPGSRFGSRALHRMDTPPDP